MAIDCITNALKRWLVIKRFMNPGSISELAMRLVPLAKTFYVYFLLGPNSPPVVAAQPDKRPANRTPKRVLCFGAVRQAQSAWFVRTNDYYYLIEVIITIVTSFMTKWC